MSRMNMLHIHLDFVSFLALGFFFEVLKIFESIAPEVLRSPYKP